MDLRIHGAEATEEEREAVDGVLGPPLTGWVGGARAEEGDRTAHGGHDARDQRQLLLPTLHAVQERIGWISPGALNYVCLRLTIPPAEAYGVASFYALFALEPRAPTVVHVCNDIGCTCRGADQLMSELEQRVGPSGEHPDNGRAIWLESPCLGLCERAPAVMVTHSGEDAYEHVIAPAGADAVIEALGGAAASPPPLPDLPQTDQSGFRLLRRVRQVDPKSLSSYRAHGGYEALRRAIGMGPQAVVVEVTESNLLGRGGAAFPTGRKWDAVARHPVRPHHLVCNADESEPGTFKDRVVMESDPFALVEAMTVAGFATGSERGYLYLRGEYPLAHERLGDAIEQARVHGFLGDDVMGHGVAFDIEIRKGAGAYICGEETALFNSIEGKRGEPRNKPPFPVDQGLFGQPTVVNNVESLLNVLDIVHDGGAAYAKIGTEQSTGTRLFCMSGCIERPGLIEAPFGIRLGELLEMAGGVAGGRPLKAILLGGAAGVFVGPDALDLELSFEATRAAGATLGSGVVMVFDDTVDLVPVLLRIAAFFRDESCGQCVPCRVGTVRQQEALLRLAANRPRGSVEDEIALLGEITQGMRDASICGLGQTAANAIDSALRVFSPFPAAEVS